MPAPRWWRSPPLPGGSTPRAPSPGPPSPHCGCRLRVPRGAALGGKGALLFPPPPRRLLLNQERHVGGFTAAVHRLRIRSHFAFGRRRRRRPFASRGGRFRAGGFRAAPRFLRTRPMSLYGTSGSRSALLGGGPALPAAVGFGFLQPPPAAFGLRLLPLPRLAAAPPPGFAFGAFGLLAFAAPPPPAS